MSRGLTVVLILIIAGLAALVAWPSADGPAPVQMPALGPVPTTLSIRLGERQIEIDGAQAQIDGQFALPADQAALAAWWQRFASQRPVTARQVASADLAAFGIDGSRELIIPGQPALRWGYAEDLAWWAIDGQVVGLSAGAGRRLEAALHGLVRPTLLPTGSVTAVEVGEVRVEQQPAAWRAGGRSPLERFDGRVSALYRYLDTLPVASFTPLPAAAARTPLATLITTDGAQTPLIRASHAGLVWLVVGEAPPQVLSAADQAHLDDLLVAFTEVRPFDTAPPPATGPDSMVVERSGRPWFVLARDGGDDRNPDGRSTWTVTWAAGHETADPAAARRLVATVRAIAVSEMTVSDTQPDWRLAPDAVRLVAVGEGMTTIDVTWLGNRLALPGATATAAALPDLLANLSPAACFERRLVPEAVRRVERIQQVRVADDGRRQYLHLRRGDAGWLRLPVDDHGAPTGEAPQAVDPLVVARLLDALQHATALEVRAATAVPPVPSADGRFLALRLAPLENPRNGQIDDLADAIASDRWWQFQTADDGAWLAMAGHADVAYRLDTDTVDQLWADWAARPLVPLAPARVDVVSIEPSGDPGAALHLLRTRDGWTATDGNGMAVPLDQSAVAAWLQRVLASQRTHPPGQAEPPRAGDADVAGVIEFGAASMDGALTRWHLVVGRALVDGRRLVAVAAGREQAPEAVAVTLPEAVLLPSATALAPLLRAGEGAP